MKTFPVARAGIVALLCLGALGVTAQKRPLNPIVKVLANPAASAEVSSECQKALALQTTPRVEISDVAQPQPKARKIVEPPPSKSLRSQLAAGQDAAFRGDRAGFRDALARVKATLETYPTGGERDAATAAVRVYSDLDRLWSYEFDSRTGAFFDASTGLVDMMTGYAGWQAFIEKQAVSAGGTKMYPSRESRDFLVSEAAKRLARLGVTVSPKPAPAGVERERIAARTSPPERAAAASRAAAPRLETRTAQERTTSGVSRVTPTRKRMTTSSKASASTGVAKKRHRTTARTATRKTPGAASQTTAKTTAAAPRKSAKVTPPVKVAEAKPAPVKAFSSTPAATSTSASAPESSASPISALTRDAESSTRSEPMATPGAMGTSAATQSGVATTAEVPAATSEVPSVSTSATATEGTATATTDTATASTGASTEPAPQQPQRQGRSVILPIILIVVGLGVLIVLFRASS